MKKLLTITALLAILSFNAKAAVKNPFYVGIGYQTTKVGYEKDSITLSDGSSFFYDNEDYFSDDFSNLNLFAGYQISENLGVEISYFSKDDEKKNNNNTGLEWSDTSGALTTTAKSSLTVVDLDAIYNISLDSQDRIKLLGLLGLSYIDSESDIIYYDAGSLRTSSSLSDDGLGANIAVGVEVVAIKDLASVRALAKYTKVGGISGIDNLTSYNIGVKFNF